MWDDPLMYTWVELVAPLGAQARACRFGKDWAKSWMFVANRLRLALTSGCRVPPLSEAELHPYISDLWQILGIPESQALDTLHIHPGQPFRLKLWTKLADFLTDADVPVGVNEQLAPSPAWPQHKGTVSQGDPLLQCHDSWKSVADQAEIVQQLIDEEVESGFIEPIPGGMSQLKESYEEIAVGKLGLVLAEGRVVDSSLSNVTSNTTLRITCFFHVSQM
eukprot:s4429_g2.t1